MEMLSIDVSELISEKPRIKEQNYTLVNIKGSINGSGKLALNKGCPHTCGVWADF